MRLVWLFAINRTTIPRIYNCSELVCAIVDLGIVDLSVMCVHYGHNLFIYLKKLKLNILGMDSVTWVCSKKCACLFRTICEDMVDLACVRVL